MQLKFEPVMLAATPWQNTEATPERRSVELPVTVTGVSGTAAPFEGDVMVTAGGVLSMLRLTEVAAIFPALSRAVAVITWWAPSDVTRTGPGQLAIPLRESTHVKVRVT